MNKGKNEKNRKRKIRKNMKNQNLKIVIKIE